MGLPANDNPKAFDPGVSESQELHKDRGIVAKVASKSWEMVLYSLCVHVLPPSVDVVPPVMGIRNLWAVVGCGWRIFPRKIHY